MIFRFGIWFIMLFGGIGLAYYIDSILFDTSFYHNLVFQISSFSFGLLLMVLLVRISRTTGRTLAKYGRQGDIKRMETNLLVKEGVYQYMRHPMHLGLFLFPISVAFLVVSPSFILIIAPVEILFMVLMIKFFEEPEAISKFGTEYLDYKQQVPWFCFKISCLQELLKKIPKN